MLLASVTRPAALAAVRGIDYSALSKDPNADKSTAGYVYAPGTPVAVRG